MITESDAQNTIELDKYYAILPNSAKKEKYINHFKGQSVSKDFIYSSKTNTQWIGVDEMRVLIKKHVDPTFDLSLT